jgi:hypothetical protein
MLERRSSRGLDRMRSCMLTIWRSAVVGHCACPRGELCTARQRAACAFPASSISLEPGPCARDGGGRGPFPTLLAFRSRHRVDGVRPCPNVHDVGRLHPGQAKVRALAHGLRQHAAEAVEDDSAFPSIDCAQAGQQERGVGAEASGRMNGGKLRRSGPGQWQPLCVVSTMHADGAPTGRGHLCGPPFQHADCDGVTSGGGSME